MKSPNIFYPKNIISLFYCLIILKKNKQSKNILIINTADTPEKVIDINNSILNLNYQKNIKNIKILNKIGNLDKDKLINKYEFQKQR